MRRRSAEKIEGSKPGASVMITDAKEDDKFNALLWLSDHLRQFTKTPGQTKYRERFDARRAAMREILAAQTGVCTLDLLDKPPSTELEVEETKTEAEVEEATQLLAAVPGTLYSVLAPEFQDRLIKSMTFAEYDDGGVISEQGQPVTHIFMVVEGEVDSDAKPTLNGADNEELVNVMLKRTYSRGQWWPPESVLDTPLFATTKASNGKVRVAKIPVDFFRGMVLPASLMARQIHFSEVYNHTAMASIPRYVRVLLALECMMKKVAEDEATLHGDSRAVVLLTEGNAMAPSGEQYKAGDIVGKLFDDSITGPIHGAPQCSAYIAPRNELQRVLVDPVNADTRPRLASMSAFSGA
jgi:CRP-like cAMP-binding protein